MHILLCCFPLSSYGSCFHILISSLKEKANASLYTVDANHGGLLYRARLNAFFFLFFFFFLSHSQICMQRDLWIIVLDFHIYSYSYRKKLLSLHKRDEIKLEIKSLNKTQQFYYMHCLSKTLQPDAPPGHFCTIADIKMELDSYSQVIKWPEMSMRHGLQWTVRL